MREPDLADARVFACSECPDSLAFCDHEGEPIGWPGSEATRDARAKVRTDQVWRLLEGAPASHRETSETNPRSLALDRIAGFLAFHLDLSRDDGRLDCLSLDQCRQAWRILRAAEYGDVQAWAVHARDKRRRAA